MIKSISGMIKNQQYPEIAETKNFKDKEQEDVVLVSYSNVFEQMKNNVSTQLDTYNYVCYLRGFSSEKLCGIRWNSGKPMFLRFLKNFSPRLFFLKVFVLFQCFLFGCCVSSSWNLICRSGIYSSSQKHICLNWFGARSEWTHHSSAPPPPYIRLFTIGKK